MLLHLPHFHFDTIQRLQLDSIALFTSKWARNSGLSRLPTMKLINEFCEGGVLCVYIL